MSKFEEYPKMVTDSKGNRVKVASKEEEQQATSKKVAPVNKITSPPTE